MLKSAKKAATSATFTLAALVLGTTASLAFEAPKYDRKIEAAAMEIVAKKIGDIRGSVAENAWVAEYGIDDVVTGPVPEDHATLKPDGLKSDALKPAVQMASLTPSVPSFPQRLGERPVRKVSSFIFF